MPRFAFSTRDAPGGCMRLARSPPGPFAFAPLENIIPFIWRARRMNHWDEITTALALAAHSQRALTKIFAARQLPAKAKWGARGPVASQYKRKACTLPPCPAGGGDSFRLQHQFFSLSLGHGGVPRRALCCWLRTAQNRAKNARRTGRKTSFSSV